MTHTHAVSCVQKLDCSSGHSLTSFCFNELWIPLVRDIGRKTFIKTFSLCHYSIRCKNLDAFGKKLLKSTRRNMRNQVSKKARKQFLFVKEKENGRNVEKQFLFIKIFYFACLFCHLYHKYYTHYIHFPSSYMH